MNPILARAIARQVDVTPAFVEAVADAVLSHPADKITLVDFLAILEQEKAGGR